MRHRFLKFLTCVVLAAGIPLVAQAQSGNIMYDCVVSDLRGGGGWISPRVVMIMDGGTSATVIDGVIQRAGLTSVRGRFDRNTASKLVMRWRIANPGEQVNGGTAEFEYTARLDKSSGAFELWGKPLGYSNRFRGFGTCSVRAS